MSVQWIMTPSESFVGDCERLLSSSLNYGGQNVPRGVSPRDWLKDVDTTRRFYAACHRGFEKAQRLALQMIRSNRSDESIDQNEKTRRELITRKVVDGIAYTMTMMETHVMRRLCIHESVPGLDVSVVEEAILASERLNMESRQTFALVCDLSTFIHVCDLLRIDLRSGRPRVEMIELKSGFVNALLLEQLKEYPGGDAGIEAVDIDSAIRPDHKAQAKRILRQEKRRQQAREILTNDIGTDPGYQVPIQLSEEAYVLDRYDHFLDDLCDDAMRNGCSAGTVQHCVHIAVAYDERVSESRRTARNAMQCLLHQHELRSPSSLRQLRSDFEQIIPANQRYRAHDALACNLATVPCRPFVLWDIKPEHILRLIDGRLCVTVCLDVVSHVWLAKQCGVEMGFSSRAEAASLAKRLGRGSVPMWGNRVLTYQYGQEGASVLGGHFNRILNDLNCPLSLIQIWRGCGRTAEPRLRQFQTAVRLTLRNR